MIEQATLIYRNGRTRPEVFVSMTDAGWSALEFADDVLSGPRPEPTLSVAEEGDYLAKIRFTH